MSMRQDIQSLGEWQDTRPSDVGSNRDDRSGECPIGLVRTASDFGVRVDSPSIPNCSTGWRRASWWLEHERFVQPAPLVRESIRIPTSKASPDGNSSRSGRARSAQQAGQPTQAPAAAGYLSEEGHPSLVVKKDRQRYGPKGFAPFFTSSHVEKNPGRTRRTIASV
jgi:hypothetical protein